MKKLVALVAALALTVPLAGCGLRDRRGGPDRTSQHVPGVEEPVEQSAEALDDVADLLDDVDAALVDVDTFAAAADED
jgi:hypothetical protein